MAQTQYKRTPSKNQWAHRKLKWGGPDADPQRGADVKALQRAYNRLPVSVRGVDRKLKVDGEFGRHTLGSVRHAARALGIGLGGVLSGKHGVSIYVQHLLRHPAQRTPIQKRRGERFRKEHPPQPPSATVSGNTVTGGKSVGERVVAGHMQASHLYYTGQSHRFYSQPGVWDADHEITGPTPGHRDDCSLYVTGIAKSAGAPDPNASGFSNGWTGSLAAHCREITREQLAPGCLVIYFNGPNSHHVEAWVGNGDGHTTYVQLANAGSQYRDRTVGHGSPPVDFGDIDMIAGARFFRPPGLTDR